VKTVSGQLRNRVSFVSRFEKLSKNSKEKPEQQEQKTKLGGADKSDVSETPEFQQRDGEHIRRESMEGSLRFSTTF